MREISDVLSALLVISIDWFISSRTFNWSASGYSFFHSVSSTDPNSASRLSCFDDGVNGVRISIENRTPTTPINTINFPIIILILSPIVEGSRCEPNGSIVQMALRVSGGVTRIDYLAWLDFVNYSYYIGQPPVKLSKAFASIFFKEFGFVPVCAEVINLF